MSSDDSTSSEDDVPSLYPKRFKIQDLYYLNKKSRKATDTSKFFLFFSSLYSVK